MTKNRLYIAYGSNLHLPQMAFRCPTAKVVGASEVKGYELLFRGGSRGAVATIEPLEGPVLDQPWPPVMSAAFGDFKLLDDVAVLCDENGAPGFFGLSVMEDLPGRPRG